MQAINEGTFTFMGLRMVDIFFKVRPEMIERAEEVEMGTITCPSCKEKSLDAWIYLENGKWQAEKVWSICKPCQQEALSKKITRDLMKKRQEVIEGSWYHVPDSDESGFKNFEALDEQTRVALENAKAFARVIAAGGVGNLRIAGSTGTGKTHLAKAIARTAKHAGINVAFIEAAKLFEMIKATFGNDYERRRLDEQFAGFDVMVIDDIGVETKKRDEISWTSSEWVKLIDMRKDKSTIYTTNFDDDSLRKVIGARAESRMSVNAVTIDLFTSKDYRKRSQGEQL